MSGQEERSDLSQLAKQSARHLGESSVSRLWSHGMHEDNMFMQRGNFFLVAQSLLLVAYSAVLSRSGSSMHSALVASRIIAGFGLAIAVMWIVTSYLHLSYVLNLRERMLTNVPEYRDTRLPWEEKQPHWARHVDIFVLIAYGVPALACILWVMLLSLV
jgi:hypothetical protein